MEMLKSGTKPDMILLDVIMPHMDGFEFIQEAKHKELHLPPIIVLTSQQDDIDKMKAFALGADHFVSKAVATPKEILEKIGAMLQKKE